MNTIIMPSKGLMQDIFVLQFAHSILKVSMSEDIRKDDELIQHKGEYRTEVKIDRNLSKLISKIQETIDIIIDTDIAKFLQKNTNTKDKKALEFLQNETISLESLALNILYVNFCERKKKLDDRLNWLTDEKQYFRINDLLEKTAVSQVEDRMFLLAYDVISILKG